MADHIVPLSALGIGRTDPAALDPENLQAACEPCHAEKSHAESRAGSARYAESRRRRRSRPHPGD
jgi:5-methylcytosine-specific restriction endonuclease McrA